MRGRLLYGWLVRRRAACLPRPLRPLLLTRRAPLVGLDKALGMTRRGAAVDASPLPHLDISVGALAGTAGFFWPLLLVVPFSF